MTEGDARQTIANMDVVKFIIVAATVTGLVAVFIVAVLLPLFRKRRGTAAPPTSDDLAGRGHDHAARDVHRGDGG